MAWVDSQSSALITRFSRFFKPIFCIQMHKFLCGICAWFSTNLELTQVNSDSTFVQKFQPHCFEPHIFAPYSAQIFALRMLKYPVHDVPLDRWQHPPAWVYDENRICTPVLDLVAITLDVLVQLIEQSFQFDFAHRIQYDRLIGRAGEDLKSWWHCLLHKFSFAFRYSSMPDAQSCYDRSKSEELSKRLLLAILLHCEN
jgi:hypothetical protein